MRRKFSSIALLAWLLLASRVAVAEPSYAIHAPNLVLEVAQAGALTLAIVPAQGHWVDLRAPVQIRLMPSGPGGVALGKSHLGHADVVNAGRKTLRFVLPIKATEAGDYEITVDARFWLCQKRVCWPLQQRIRLEVLVNPAETTASVGQDGPPVE